jgi:hypothetical protein
MRHTKLDTNVFYTCNNTNKIKQLKLDTPNLNHPQNYAQTHTHTQLDIQYLTHTQLNKNLFGTLNYKSTIRLKPLHTYN